MSSTRNRIRIAVDLANPLAAPKNILTRRTPDFVGNRATRVDVGIYDNGLFQASVAQFDSMTFELMAYATRTGARLVTKTVAAPFTVASLNAWQDVSQEHATFQMTASEMNVFTYTDNKQSLWMVITALAGSERVTLAAGAATAILDGGVYAGASAPAVGDPTYLTGNETIAAIDARSNNPKWVSNGYEVVPEVIAGEIVWHIRLI